MSTLNIGGDKSDSSYRYKMPALVTKIEGRGNGIKTVILNMAELAKSLHIHPAYPTKFFGIELGAQSKYSAASDRAVVNGAHQPGDLAKILERFIQQFILCPRCKLPELKMSVKSSIKIDCAACGHNATIKTTHKLAQYMIKNPPSALAAEEEVKAKKGKKVKAGDLDLEVPEVVAAVIEKEGKKKGGKRVHKKDLKKKGEAGEGDDGEDENGLDDEDDELAEEEPEEVEEVKEKKPKKKKEKVIEEELVGATKKEKKLNDDDVWHTDTSKEAQQARKEAEFREQRADAASASIEAILASTKLDATKAETPVTTLKLFLAKGNRRTEEIVAEVKRITLAKGLDLSAKLRLVLEAVVETENVKDGKGVAAALHKYRAVLTSYTGERVNDVALICGVEELLGATHREWITGVPWVLKQLDEDEVVHEDSIIGWYDSPPESSWLVKKEVAVEVRQRGKVYVEHLKTLESDEDDEEGEEDDEEEDDEEEA